MKTMIKFLISSFIFLILMTAFLAVDFHSAYKNLIDEVHHGDASDRQKMHRPDSKLGWTLLPNKVQRHNLPEVFDVVYQTDDQGFKKINNLKNNPHFSLYFFGDSFTFGYGVENNKTFPNILKNELLSDKINVFNTAVMGYGITQMYQRFLNISETIKPGDLIIFTPIADDITRNLHDFYFPYLIFYSNSLFVKQYPLYENNEISYPILKRNLYTFIKTLALTAPLTGFIWRKINDQLHSDPGILALEMIKKAKVITEKKGGNFILIFLPTDNDCINEKFQKIISTFESFSICDQMPNNPEQLDTMSFATNSHWNAYGHQIIAKAILNNLIKNNFLKTLDLK